MGSFSSRCAAFALLMIALAARAHAQPSLEAGAETPAPDSAPPAETEQPVAPPSAEPQPVEPEPAAPDSAAPPVPTAPEAGGSPFPEAIAEPEPARASAAPRPRSAAPAAEADNYRERASWLYVRLAAGVGFPFGSDVADVYDDRNGAPLHFSGYGLATDWMAGRALLPGLVLGLGFSADTIVGGTVRNRDDDKRDLEKSLYMMVVGGFVDVYFTPPAGFHVQALLGLAHLSRADDIGNAVNGFGAVLGFGYEIAVGQRWNVGVLGRLALSPLGTNEVAGERTSPSFYEPSLLWTMTFRPER
jgi:hypothetical protein